MFCLHEVNNKSFLSAFVQNERLFSFVINRGVKNAPAQQCLSLQLLSANYYGIISDHLTGHYYELQLLIRLLLLITPVTTHWQLSNYISKISILYNIQNGAILKKVPHLELYYKNVTKEAGFWNFFMVCMLRQSCFSKNWYWSKNVFIHSYF